MCQNEAPVWGGVEDMEARALAWGVATLMMGNVLLSSEMLVWSWRVCSLLLWRPSCWNLQVAACWDRCRMVRSTRAPCPPSITYMPFKHLYGQSSYFRPTLKTGLLYSSRKLKSLNGSQTVLFRRMSFYHVRLQLPRNHGGLIFQWGQIGSSLLEAVKKKPKILPLSYISLTVTV